MFLQSIKWQIEYSLPNKQQRRKIGIISFLFPILKIASSFRKGVEKKESIVKDFSICKNIHNRKDTRG